MEEQDEASRKPSPRKREKPTFHARLKRLLTVIQLCQFHRPRIREIAEICRVNERTVYRDILDLRKAGVVISTNEKTSRVHVSQPMRIPQMHLTLEETLAIVLFCNFSIKKRRSPPFMDAAFGAVQKLLDAIPDRMVKTLTELQKTVFLQGEPVNPLLESRPVFETIQKAILQGLKIRVSYKRPLETEAINTLIDPYSLFFARRSWYLIGRASLYAETRTFHLGRITKIEITDQPYMIPQGFSPEKYFGNAWCMIREPGPDQQVIVRFSPLVAQNVSEVQWHKTQRIVPDPQDGSILFHAQVSGLNEISWWILGYGKEAEVLQPPALREKIRRHVEELVKLYVTEETSAANPQNAPSSHPAMKHPLE